MIITAGEKEYELSAKLRAIQKIETHFKRPVTSIFDNLNAATTEELITIIRIASGADRGETELRDALLDNWDYFDLTLAVKDLIINMMFSGTPEAQEKKINAFTDDENVKNEIRGSLGLPIKPLTEQTEDLTGSES